MADLGALVTRTSPLAKVQKTSAWWAAVGGLPGGSIVAKVALLAKRIPLYLGASQQTISYDCTGQRSGSVKIGTTPIPNAKVVLFHRQSFSPVAITPADANGNFTFSDLYREPGGYFALAFYPDGEVAHNALVFDSITPI